MHNNINKFIKKILKILNKSFNTIISVFSFNNIYKKEELYKKDELYKKEELYEDIENKNYKYFEGVIIDDSYFNFDNNDNYYYHKIKRKNNFVEWGWFVDTDKSF